MEEDKKPTSLGVNDERVSLNAESDTGWNLCLCACGKVLGRTNGSFVSKARLFKFFPTVCCKVRLLRSSVGLVRCCDPTVSFEELETLAAEVGAGTAAASAGSLGSNGAVAAFAAASMLRTAEVAPSGSFVLRRQVDYVCEDFASLT